jgi:hypothetical protein
VWRRPGGAMGILLEYTLSGVFEVSLVLGRTGVITQIQLQIETQKASVQAWVVPGGVLALSVGMLAP